MGIIDWGARISIISSHFVDQIRREHGVDLSQEPLALHRIKDAAEQIKIQLDVVNNVNFQLPYIMASNGHTFNANLIITRLKLEEPFDGLITRTITHCDQALRDAGLKREEIDHIVLVGGMSRMPAIRQRVSKYFGRVPKLQLDPSRIVAYGAAQQNKSPPGRWRRTKFIAVRNQD